MSPHTPAADFHALTPDVIISVVEKAVGHHCTNLCRPLNSYINRVYELELEEGGGIIGKFYRPGRWSRQTIADEHDFLAELTEREIPVIPPLPLAGGQTLGEHRGIFFAVFPKKSGRILDELTLDQWEEIGRLLGRVHRVGAMRQAQARPLLAPQESTRRHVSYLIEGRFIPAELVEDYRRISAELLETITPLFAGHEAIRIHGDCHFSNIILRPGESFYLIDLDDMVTGPPVQDLWMLLPGYARDSRAEIAAFLEGYETFRPFPRRTLSLIEPLRAMRFIHYSAWCAYQAADVAFSPLGGDWGSAEYWRQEIRDLAEQIAHIRDEDGLP
ncbi:MAG: serine/threonine protein kinase [Thermodesulfobacteriota bacterium]